MDPQRMVGVSEGGSPEPLCAAVTPELVVVGNLLVDDLVFASGETRLGVAGGAVLHTALGAARWGTKVGCVSLRGQDYPADTLAALRGRRIDLSGVHALPGLGVRTWLLYEPQSGSAAVMRRMIPHLGRPEHAAVSPTLAHFPPGWAQARAIHLAPMPLPVQRALVEALAGRQGGLVALDPHLPLSAETLPAWRPVLAQVEVLFLGEDELQLAGVTERPAAVLRELRGGRLRYVLCKRGARGGVLYDVLAERLLPWSAKADPVVDPTGAGDAFAGGFLSGLLAGSSVQEALWWGVESAGRALAGWGADGLLA